MFDQTDYKKVLAAIVEKNKAIRGYQQRLAKACGCHTSFISQVLRSHVHLTPDHAASLVEFWGFSDLEREYFMALVQLARSSSKAYKEYLQAQIKRLRSQHKSVTTRIGGKQLSKDESEGAKAFYYSSWHVMAIHVLCSIEGMNSAAVIAKRLRLSPNLVNRTLKQLIDYGYLVEAGKGYEVTAKDLHLPGKSHLINVHHSNWRHYAVSRLPLCEGTHYSAAMAIAREDFELLKENLLKFLEVTKRTVTKSKEEEVFCLNLDFFPL